MTRISINDIQTGMILDEEIKNSTGAVLVLAGVEIAEKHIKAMKMWGIPDVRIRTDAAYSDNKNIQNIDLEKIKLSTTIIAKRFTHADLKHPVMRALFKIATLHHATNS